MFFILFFSFFSEVIGGYLSGSLAIMSDAAHMFSDLASFLISLMAIHLSEKPAKKELKQLKSSIYLYYSNTKLKVS